MNRSNVVSFLFLITGFLALFLGLGVASLPHATFSYPLTCFAFGVSFIALAYFSRPQNKKAHKASKLNPLFPNLRRMNLLDLASFRAYLSFFVGATAYLRPETSSLYTSSWFVYGAVLLALVYKAQPSRYKPHTS